jgi:shikimate dehydrogenase
VSESTPHRLGSTRHSRKRKVLLLGNGISRSISPDIHNKAFHELGLDIEYDLCEIPIEKLGSTLSQILKDELIIGFNVTIPFKEQIIRYLSELDSSAKMAGSVNLVSISQNRKKLVGYNTDIDGVVASLSKLGLLGRSGQKALVLGAGGAARGCVVALLSNGFDFIVVLNRTEKRAEAISSEFSSRFMNKKITTGALTRIQLDSALTDIDLLVNSIPMTSELPFVPDFTKANRAMRVLDLNYRKNPPMLELAKKEGLVCLDGSLMLVEQAARSFEILTDISAPRKTMMLVAGKQDTNWKD